jgi:hypothetical protein
MNIGPKSERSYDENLKLRRYRICIIFQSSCKDFNILDTHLTTGSECDEIDKAHGNTADKD